MAPRSPQGHPHPTTMAQGPAMSPHHMTKEGPLSSLLSAVQQSGEWAGGLNGGGGGGGGWEESRPSGPVHDQNWHVAAAVQLSDLDKLQYSHCKYEHMGT